MATGYRTVGAVTAVTAASWNDARPPHARAYILHEFFADGSNFFGESGGEHHHLLFVRRQAEDVLHVTSHVWQRKG